MSKNKNIWIILLAGGMGTRFGGLKQFESLGKRRVLEWSLETARTISPNTVLVLPKDSKIADWDIDPGIQTTEGGKTRSESVRAGIQEVDKEAEIILIHDVVRPLASPDLYKSVIKAIHEGADASAPAIPITDTIHNDAGEFLDRSTLRALQTPQAFKAEPLRKLHKHQPEASDDTSLFLDSGCKLTLVQGDTRNLKITEPKDLALAAALMEMELE